MMDDFCDVEVCMLACPDSICAVGKRSNIIGTHELAKQVSEMLVTKNEALVC